MHDYFDCPRPELVEIWQKWGPLDVVIDIGCGAGWLGQQLLERGLAREVIGVERHAAAAARARTRLSAVLQSDLNDQEVWEHLPQSYDGLVFADVLEHLRDPEPILAAGIERLRDGGRVLISVPNIRQVRVLSRLMFRNLWEYADEGICDADHVRFFTSRTLARLVDDQGLSLAGLYPLLRGRRRFVGDRVKWIASFLAPQYVAVAIKPDA